MDVDYLLRASYGNDSCALIQWAHEEGLHDLTVLYNDTGWSEPSWNDRVTHMEEWARSYGFQTVRTKSMGMEALVRQKKGWPRQGIQFCTSHLKMIPTEEWMREHDQNKLAVSIIGVRRAESANRRNFPMWSIDYEGRTVWAPLANYTDEARNELLQRARIEPLPHRSMECSPCINSNRADLLAVTEDRIAEIEKIEQSMGFTKEGKPRTMFRPYRYMGATGIREIIRWARSPRGKFDIDDGNGSSGCEAGWCGS